MKHLIQFILCAAWIAGIVIAKGFWSTFFACIIPPWAFYLVVERAIIASHLLQ